MKEKLGLLLNWEAASIAHTKTLGNADLHIWHIELTLNKKQSEIALSLLSDMQRDKYHRRNSAELKHQYLAGRYYLLTLLGAYTNIKAQDVSLSYGHLNKPRLSNAKPNLEFNFTDTDGYGMFAFSKHAQVGIDLERLDREINIEAIAKRRFTEEELKYVKCKGNYNHQRCIAIWTRKEAYGKATGQGINFKMNQRNLFSSDDCINQHQFIDEKQNKWTCNQLSTNKKEHIASVVYEGHEPLKIKAFNSLT